MDPGDRKIEQRNTEAWKTEAPKLRQGKIEPKTTLRHKTEPSIFKNLPILSSISPCLVHLQTLLLFHWILWLSSCTSSWVLGHFFQPLHSVPINLWMVMSFFRSLNDFVVMFICVNSKKMQDKCGRNQTRISQKSFWSFPIFPVKNWQFH